MKISQSNNSFPAKPGMCQYWCYSDRARAHYLSVNMFRDILGDAYAKPLYIEKTKRTRVLEGLCQERMLRDRPFYSLIKTPSGTYRFNAQIYDEGERFLGLQPEHQACFGINLMRMRDTDVLEVLDPPDAYTTAIDRNPVLSELVRALPIELTSDKERLGLIGLAAVDPLAQTRDLDLVFSGPTSWLDRICHWLREENCGGPPLRRHLSAATLTVCAFFHATPTAYPRLDNTRVHHLELLQRRVRICSVACPSYLNVQVYMVRALPQQDVDMVIVRDTVARQMLCPEMIVDVTGYPATLGPIRAILLTDAEQQLHGARLHGGGTECD